MALKGPVQGGSEEVVSQAGGAHFRLGIAFPWDTLGRRLCRAAGAWDTLLLVAHTLQLAWFLWAYESAPHTLGELAVLL